MQIQARLYRIIKLCLANFKTVNFDPLKPQANFLYRLILSRFTSLKPDDYPQFLSDRIYPVMPIARVCRFAWINPFIMGQNEHVKSAIISTSLLSYSFSCVSIQWQRPNQITQAPQSMSPQAVDYSHKGCDFRPGIKSLLVCMEGEGWSR